MTVSKKNPIITEHSCRQAIKHEYTFSFLVIATCSEQYIFRITFVRVMCECNLWHFLLDLSVHAVAKYISLKGLVKNA